MEEKNTVKLDDRLSSAASFVREGAVVADIGTDHAYIPVYLLENGIAKFAIASDVNKGPLERAVENARKYGVADRMRFTLADGLNGVEPERDSVTDIVICGMGGELIARIVDESEYTRKSGVRLILQPMTAADDLRKYLDENGFAVIDEKLSTAAGKTYCCMLAEYDGVKRTSTAAELLLGKIAIKKRELLFEKYAGEILARLDTKIKGMKKGGLPTDEEEKCRHEIAEILEEKR